MEKKSLSGTVFCSCAMAIWVFGMCTVLPVMIVVFERYRAGLLSGLLWDFVLFCAITFAIIAVLFSLAINLMIPILVDEDRSVRFQVWLIKSARWTLFYTNPIGLPARYFWQKILVPLGEWLVGWVCLLLLISLPNRDEGQE